MSFQVAITQAGVCPDLQVLDASAYGIFQSEFSYATMTIVDPSGATTVWSSLSSTNYLPPPSSFSSQPLYSLEYGLVGLYTVTLFAPPVLGNTVPSGTSFTIGQQFYYAGSFYQSTANFVTFGIATAASFIATNTGNGNLIVISQSQVSSIYTGTSTFATWCGLTSCLLDKLAKYNKVNANEVPVNKIDLSDELDSILQLNYIYQYLQVNNFDYSNPDDINTITKFANYINTICSCKTCKC